MKAIASMSSIIALCLTAQLATAKDSVRIGFGGNWPAFGVWYVIQEKGLAPDLDLQFAILEDPLQVQSMLAAGSFDLVDSTFDYVPIASERKLPIKLVAVHNLSHGGDQIITAADVAIPGGIRGQTLAASFGYLGQLVAAVWLQSNGLTLDAIKWQDLSVEEAAANMLSGKVKMAYLYQPYASEVLQRLKGSKMAFSTADPKWMVNPMGGDAITMSDGFIGKHRDVAVRVLKAYFVGEAYWAAHPLESNTIIAKAMHYSVTDVSTVMGSNGSGTDGEILVEPFLFAARFCGVAPGEPLPGEKNGQVFASLQEIGNWRVKLGQMKSAAAAKDGVDCSLLADLVASHFDTATH